MRSPPPVLTAFAGALLVALAACGGSSAPQGAVRVLVVGDSVIAQSATALADFSPPGVDVSVAAGVGTAPCDWVHGFKNLFGGKRQVFASALAAAHPSVVIFMFTGNPGLSGVGAGCADASAPYSLQSLLATYAGPLKAMATLATQAGAEVRFEASPPRNPAVPSGFAPGNTGGGYNGVPAVSALLPSIASQAPPGARWFAAEGGSAAVSTPELSWEATVPCQVWDQRRCQAGRVAIRAGGGDAVHLDPSGCGAIRFAMGLLRFSSQARPVPSSLSSGELRADISRYPYCR